MARMPSAAKLATGPVCSIDLFLEKGLPGKWINSHGNRMGPPTPDGWRSKYAEEMEFGFIQVLSSLALQILRIV